MRPVVTEPFTPRLRSEVVQFSTLSATHDAPDELGVVVENRDVIGCGVELLGDGNHFIMLDERARWRHALAAVAIPEELRVAVGDDITPQLGRLVALGARERVGHSWAISMYALMNSVASGATIELP